MDIAKQALNIADFRRLARRRLPAGLFEFIERGNEDDVALRNNRAALERIKLRPRVLVDVSKRDQGVTVFGRRQPMPLGIAPTGPTGYVWHRGEVALARAASRAGIPITISSAAATPLEEIVRDGGDGPKWFQLYMSADRALSLKLVERARDAGYETLVFTVDSVIASNREFVVRSGFTIPFRLNPRSAWDLATHPRWLFGTMGRYLMSTGVPHLPNYPIPDQRDPIRGGVAMKDETITWETLRIVRDMWPGKLVVKGIMDARDALSALEHGADAVTVSNHGAVMLDSAQATIEILPEVVAAVGGRAPVFIDSGFRRGTDVVKALALGAQAVFVGRATLYAVAAAGEAGASHALDLLRAEIDRTLAVLGCAGVGDLKRDHVIMPGDAPLRAG